MRIAIEGGIGSGKTSTAILVAEQLGWSAVLEQTETHPFLADFYSDVEKFKLETELAFVLLHYHQLHPLDSAARVVTDFSQGKDLIFARMNLEGDGLDLFEVLYSRLSARISPPTLTVVLDVPIMVLMERILRRARSYEVDMPPEYLKRLMQFYDKERDVLGPNVHVLSLTGDESREVVARRVVSLVHTTLDLS